jgi:hypothetical protein
MPKRNQINITLDDAEMHNVSEYCRVHNMTPQGFFKAGGKNLINEDLLKRKADLMTLQSLQEIKDGRATPIDNLLQMIDEDRRDGEEMVRDTRRSAKKTQ